MSQNHEIESFIRSTFVGLVDGIADLSSEKQ
jgi:hypothetical protein